MVIEIMETTMVLMTVTAWTIGCMIAGAWLMHRHWEREMSDILRDAERANRVVKNCIWLQYENGECIEVDIPREAMN